MTSKIEPYLQTPGAAEDVAALLANPEMSQAQVCGNGVWFWERQRAGAWIHVALNWPGPRRWGCYYRPDGERYIVTDIGASVQALRLRTGILDAPGRIGEGYFACHPKPTMAIEGMIVEVVPTADLPRAIVRVLLAACRVASLDVKP